MRRRLGLWLLRGYEVEIPYETHLYVEQPFDWRFAICLIVAGGLAAVGAVEHSLVAAMCAIIVMGFSAPAYLEDTVRGVLKKTL